MFVTAYTITWTVKCSKIQNSAWRLLNNSRWREILEGGCAKQARRWWKPLTEA